MIAHGLAGKPLPAMRMPLFKGWLFSVIQQIKWDKLANCSSNQLCLWKTHRGETSPVLITVVQSVKLGKWRGQRDPSTVQTSFLSNFCGRNRDKPDHPFTQVPTHGTVYLLETVGPGPSFTQKTDCSRNAKKFTEITISMGFGDRNWNLLHCLWNKENLYFT